MKQLSEGRFIIVDEFPTMRRFVATILKQHGVRTIEEYGSWEAAIKSAVAYESGQVMVIASCNMPGGEGLELLRAVRAEEGCTKHPVLLMASAVELESARAATKGDPFAAIIAKPFTAKALKESLLRLSHGDVKPRRSHAS